MDVNPVNPVNPLIYQELSRPEGPDAIESGGELLTVSGWNKSTLHFAYRFDRQM
jgi:hypothetical protein